MKRILNKVKCVVRYYRRVVNLGLKTLYTLDEVNKILEENNCNVKSLVAKYNKKELSSMYYVLYETEPISSYKKETIAERLRSYKLQECRYNALAQL